MKRCILAALIAVIFISKATTAAPPQNPQAQLDPNLLWEPVWKGEYKADIHVRYYDYFASDYSKKDADAKYWTFAVAIIAFVLPLTIEAVGIDKLWTWKGAAWIRRGSLIIAFGFASVGLHQMFKLNAYPYSDLKAQNMVAKQRWNDVKNEYATLKHDFVMMNYQQIAERLAWIQTLETSVENSEPTDFDAAKMLEFQDQENKVQNYPPDTAPPVTPKPGS